MDKQRIITRLDELKAEAESGQKVLAELDAKRSNVEQTLLRIHGAIQVLEELLGTNPSETDLEDVKPQR